MGVGAIEATRDAITADGVIVCVRLGPGAPLLDLCRAAVRGGLPVLEITLTTPGALDAIEALADEGTGLVGAGTVLDPADAERVAERGGRFGLSPVFDPDVVDALHARGVLAVPGAATPAEILAAHRHGARLVKVFPSGALGGPAFLRSVRGPLPDVPLVPTSGPTAENLPDYLAVGAVAVGMGGEVFPPGCTPESVEAAARRVRAAMDAARAAIEQSAR
jgi:2-dehydro-3-deoxyphosphogluconate aldolase/(4S)-4-hydroxy-2-oxoglutarate aldolase